MCPLIIPIFPEPDTSRNTSAFPLPHGSSVLPSDSRVSRLRTPPMTFLSACDNAMLICCVHTGAGLWYVDFHAAELSKVRKLVIDHRERFKERWDEHFGR